MTTEKVKKSKGLENEIKVLLVESIDAVLTKTNKDVSEKFSKKVRKAASDLSKKFAKAIKKEEKKAEKKSLKEQKKILVGKKKEAKKKVAEDLVSSNGFHQS